MQLFDVMKRSLGAHQVNSKLMFGRITQLMGDHELDVLVAKKDEKLAQEAADFINGIMGDLEKILLFPRTLINKGEMVKRLMASKDGGMSVMSAALHIVVKCLETKEYLSCLVRGCSKYHPSTVPRNESQAWVLCVRQLLEVLLVKLCSKHSL